MKTISNILTSNWSLFTNTGKRRLAVFMSSCFVNSVILSKDLEVFKLLSKRFWEAFLQQSDSILSRKVPFTVGFLEFRLLLEVVQDVAKGQYKSYNYTGKVLSSSRNCWCCRTCWCSWICWCFGRAICVKLKKVKLCYNQRVTRNRNIAYVIVLFLILVMWKAFSYTRVIHTPKMKGIHKNVTRGINSSYRKSHHWLKCISC